MPACRDLPRRAVVARARQVARRRLRVRAAVGVAAIASLLCAGSAAYVVRPGDTLSGIANRTGTSTRSLAAANGLSSPFRILAGSRLLLPGESGAGTRHTVRRGETLSGIAGRSGVGAAALAAVNGLSSVDRIREGQRLAIPPPGTTAAGVAAAPGSSGGAPSGTASRAEVGRLLEQTAQRYGWNPATIKALAWQESGWNQSVRSGAGAVGVMQVLPSTGSFVSTHLVGRRLDLSRTADNIEAGVAFIDYVHGLAGGDVEHTLGGYYQGLASIRRNGTYTDTRQYVSNVLALRERFR